jgi:gliding motility-associated-like protein
MMICNYSSAQLHVIQADNSISFHTTDLNQHRIKEKGINAYLLNSFDLNQQHGFVLRSTITDLLGETHIRYIHTLNGHKIIGSDVVCHFKNDILQSLNGRLRVPLSSPSILIEKSTALQAAKQVSGASSFKWEFPSEENMLKIWKEDSTATYYPKGALVYVPKNLDFNNEMALCYQFEINSEEPLMRKNIFINAETGSVWADEDLLHIVDVKGSANTKYRGVKPITTDSTAPGNYRLRETGRGGGIETYDMNKGTNYSLAVDFTDTDNYWNNYNANFDEIGGDAHFGAEKTYDYFKQNFNRNSFDGNGAKIRGYVHYRSNYVNAFWNGSVMTYGDGNGTSYTPLTSIDICGHEIAHAVTSNSAGLIYRNESGALNESFSDIFGNAIEYFADSTIFSWRMGEDIMASANGLRNMANPKTHRDPGTYKGQYWYGGTRDNGGVHTNSGVQNFWFYLLTTGATGKNDNGDTYTVDSLGIKKAEQIAYRNLTVYLTSSSDYAEARYYAIQSATDLYGDCSFEVQTTTNAWYAVGVGDEYDSSAVIAQFEADTTYCDATETVQFLNKSSNAKAYMWDFGDGDTSSKANPDHIYPAQGDYTVSLIAESCFNSNFDTISKKDYISIDSNQDICNGYLLPKGTWSTVHACDGFIYDHNGESDYQGLLRDTLTIDFGKSDSAHITFLEMDYENRYDSIYVYDGASTSATLLGGFTGRNLPFLGQTKTLYNGAVTIHHFSDPYVVGTGFKVKFETFKQPLQLYKPGNRKVCYNEQVTLTALGRGGDVADHAYFWNGIKGGKSFTFTATKDTLIYITFGDECMKEYLYDSVFVSVRPEITYTQSNDTALCQGNETELWVNPTGGKNTFEFETSDGSSGNGTSFRHKTGSLTPGTHHFWIRFADNCTYPDDTAFYTITVGDSLQLRTSADTTICYGSSIVLKATASGGSSGNYTFDWSPGPNSANTYTIQPNNNATYTVRLSDDCSSFEPTASVKVSVLDSLLVTIQGPDTACYGERVNMTSTVTGGKSNQYTYLWSPGGSTAELETDVLRSTKEYRLTVSDGCTPKNGQSTHTITARQPLSMVASKDTTLCLGETASMTVKTTGGIESQQNITWSHGLGTGLSKTVTPSKTNSYHVTLWDQCSDSVSADIQVVVNPKPIVNFSTQRPIHCTGIPVQFYDSSISTAPNKYLWYFGNGESSNDQNPSLIFSKTGLYDVTLKVTNSFGCVDSLTIDSIIRVIDHPIADFSFSPQDPSFLKSRVEFLNTSKHNTSSFWDFGDGISSRDQNASNFYRDSGLYTIVLRVENGIGCFDEISKSVYVADDVVIHIPTAFSPNKDGINDDFRPYIRGMKSYDLMIYNRWGEVLFKSTETAKHWDGIANGNRAILGFYFYRLTGIDMNGKEVERNGRLNVIY